MPEPRKETCTLRAASAKTTSIMAQYQVDLKWGNVSVIKSGDKYGIIDSSNTIVLSCRYHSIVPLHGDSKKRYLMICENSLYGIYDAVKVEVLYECAAKNIRIKRENEALAYEPRTLLGFIPWIPRTVRIQL